jgi:hypothetical protein
MLNQIVGKESGKEGVRDGGGWDRLGRVPVPVGQTKEGNCDSETLGQASLTPLRQVR